MPQLKLTQAVDLCQWLGVPKEASSALFYLRSHHGEIKLVRAFSRHFRIIDLKIGLTGIVDLCYSQYQREEILYLSGDDIVEVYQQAILRELDRESTIRHISTKDQARQKTIWERSSASERSSGILSKGR